MERGGSTVTVFFDDAGGADPCIGVCLARPGTKARSEPNGGSHGLGSEEQQVPLFRFNTNSPRFPAQLLAQPTGNRERGTGRS